jgi:hypothetical protein
METTMTAIIVAAQGQESPIEQRRASAHPRRRRRDLANDGALFRIAALPIARPSTQDPRNPICDLDVTDGR